MIINIFWIAKTVFIHGYLGTRNYYQLPGKAYFDIQIFIEIIQTVYYERHFILWDMDD